MKVRILLIALFTCLLATVATAQVRVRGIVTDAETGKPIAGATVILSSERAGEGAVNPIQTGRDGNWAAMLPIGGQWNIDVEKDGYLTSRGSMELSELSRPPKLETKLEKAVAAPPPPPEEATVASTVPAEAVEAVKQGEEMMRRASGKQLVRNVDEITGETTETLVDVQPAPTEQEQIAFCKSAVVEFEKAQALLPEHIELKKALSRSYYCSGQLDQAIALLDAVLAAEPTNTGIVLLQINLLAEAGKLDRAKELLDNLPPGTLTDPTAVLNVGILFLNKEQPETAWEYFDRAIGIAPTAHEGYYFRAIASLQMKKMEPAKADFQKVIELAPDSSEAADARDLIAQIR
ncbi:MAG TPA: tetratricopeptide repeat protein [Thermoanaerobaculia bacterium]|nr:tetratricopeptide repeat protein [Thermoanaerobaculia bacterium]